MTNSDTAQFVLQALNAIKKSCEDVLEKNPDIIKSGIIDNLSGTIFLVQKIRKSKESKTIGFFGAQKRGKSSLINQLIGCDLMPISPIPMSSVAIEIEQATIPDGQFKIDIFQASGKKEMSQNVDLERAKMILREYGSHKGILSSEVDTIKVSSSFPDSVIMRNHGVLVDTPGAEIAFDRGETTDITNNEDAKRAISILQKTHIVVFVERADQMESNNSKQFFEMHLRPMRPLGVLNWKDEFGKNDPKYEKIALPLREQTKIRDMQTIMLKTYGFNLDRLLCVSCKDAANAKRNNNNDLLQESNLPLLEKKILEELQNLDPDRGLVTCFEELESTLQQIKDIDLARSVFKKAQRPFYVFLRKETNETIKRIANEILNRYCSN